MKKYLLIFCAILSLAFVSYGQTNSLLFSIFSAVDEEFDIDQSVCETSKGTWTGTSCNCPDGKSLSDGACLDLSCKEGEYINGNTCSRCNAGSYCVDGVMMPCPAGQTSPSGAASCSVIEGYADCTSSGGTWNNSCQCPTSKHLVSGQCESCPANASCSNNTFSCNNNYTQSRDTCVLSACTAGQYLNGSECKPCDAGYYCTGAATGPVECPTGTTSAEGASTTAGCSIKTTCNTGEYLTNGNCATCPANFSCAGGTAQPQACPAGQQSAEGSISCGVIAGYEECTSSGGTFTNNTCSCPAGKENVDGECTECEAGKYKSTAGTNACTVCEKGFFCIGGSARATCPASTTTISTGAKTQTECSIPTACSAGEYLAGNKCEVCPTGKYCTGGATQAIDCPANTTTLSTGGTSSAACSVKTACAAGQYLDDGACLSCPAGSHCAAGATTPTRCEAGRYCPAGSGAGTICPAGSYCPAGATAQTRCEAGKYCEAGTSVGTSCPAGSYCPAGATAPTRCEAGKYCPSGSVTGTACPSGSYCPAGSGAATACPAGSYCPAGSTTTTTCAKGTWSSAGASGCTTCSANTTTASTGSTSLSACSIKIGCSIGWYLIDDDCEICPVGKYCTGTAAQPVACPINTTTPSTGAFSAAGCTVITGCPSGQYLGNGKCNVCEKGYYCEGSKREQCPVSTTTTSTGASSASACSVLTACSAGSYIANNKCTTCAKGQFCIGGAAPAANCPVNTTTASIGSTSSAACSVRTSCTTGGQYLLNGACVECPAGKYCPSGTSDATNCPANTYRSAIGAYSASLCTACPSGSTSPAGSASCTIITCPAGQYINGSVCSTCPQDYQCKGSASSYKAEDCKTSDGYTTSSGSSGCSWCSYGQQFNYSTRRCEACAKGTYKQYFSGKCVACPSGYTTSGTGATSESQCMVSTIRVTTPSVVGGLTTITGGLTRDTGLIPLKPQIAPRAPVTVAAYGQCGGIGWTGATTCESGTVCQYVNDYYSQCLPAKSTSNSTATRSLSSSSLLSTSALR